MIFKDEIFRFYVAMHVAQRVKFFNDVDHLDSEVENVFEIRGHGRWLKIEEARMRYTCAREVLDSVLVLVSVVFEVDSEVGQASFEDYAFAFFFFSYADHLYKAALSLDKVCEF